MLELSAFGPNFFEPDFLRENSFFLKLSLDFKGKTMAQFAVRLFVLMINKLS